MDNALVIINSKNKKSQFSQRLYDVLKILDSQKYNINVKFTKKRKDTYNYFLEYGNDCDIILISGGDGSIHEATNAYALLKNKPKIMYFPTGTVNDFGNSLGLTKSFPHQLAVLKAGKSKLIDIGYVNGNYFNYICAFGPFTRVSYDTSSKDKRLLGKFAYYKDAIGDIPNLTNRYKLDVNVDGEVFEGEFVGCLVVNSNSVAGIKNFIKNDYLDDGVFNLILIKKVNPISLAKGIAHILEGMSDEIDDEYFYVKKFKKLSIKTDKKIVWTLDGEKGPTGSIDIEVIEKELDIFY